MKHAEETEQVDLDKLFDAMSASAERVPMHDTGNREAILVSRVPVHNGLSSQERHSPKSRCASLRAIAHPLDSHSPVVAEVIASPTSLKKGNTFFHANWECFTRKTMRAR